ncbi:MAG: hypothetical protein LBD88_04870 [Candidatus Peribacteria bacterium]|nr:hypothetical protein [Candidatus Peribacteria bacterium]
MAKEVHNRALTVQEIDRDVVVDDEAMAISASNSLLCDCDAIILDEPPQSLSSC